MTQYVPTPNQRGQTQQSSSGGMDRVGESSRCAANFDVRLLPMKDIYASAPLEALVDWFHMLTSEMYQRQAENQCLSDWKYSFQYALVGPKGVGKTNLRLMFTENVFRVSSKSTRSVEFSRTFLQLDKERIKVQMWDTNWGTHTSSYLHGAAVIFFVFDVTKKSTFAEVTAFVDKHLSSIDSQVTKLLVGNKCDVMGREVTTEEAALFARSHGLLFMETSAKSGTNVKEAFYNTARNVLLQIKMGASMSIAGAVGAAPMKGVRVFAPEEGHVTTVMERGQALLRNGVYNKAEAFTMYEREELGLTGLLPPRVLDLETQKKRCYQQLTAYSTDLEKYTYLEGLHDRNETLYYKLLTDYISELMPIVYTPVVGKACQMFGYIYRHARGLYFNLSDKGNFKQMVWNCPNREVKIIVVTDGSRILGLGDLGTNGMGIPIGKLALYCACAGIFPAETLPVTIDVGTNNEQLLNDDLYLGVRHRRVGGDEFYALVDEFVDAVRSRWPDVLIQFEDFTNDHAFPLLHQYQEKVLCFNDDIQGTGSVALAGILTAIRFLGQKLVDQKIVFLGAGSAAIGIADMIVAGLMEEGLTEKDARAKFWFVDSKGLVTWKRGGSMQEHKIPYCRNEEPQGTLLEVIKAVEPTVLLGLSGQPGSFNEEIIMQMNSTCERPIIFALSNPTPQAECTPEQAYEWTDGQALFASGSPFKPVTISNGQKFVPGQGNNMYIFPGVGLAAIVGKFKMIPNTMFYIAAKALSSMVTEQDLAAGTMYPRLTRIRDISLEIAVQVMKVAFDKGLARIERPDDLYAAVRSRMWQPQYPRTELDPSIYALNPSHAPGETSSSGLTSHKNAFSFGDLDKSAHLHTPVGM